MYVVTDHNSQNFVILGPIAWKPRYIGDIISDEIQEDVTITQADELRVPFDVRPGVTIRRTTISHEPITNDLIQVHQGPTWTYDDENLEHQATAHWHVQDRGMDETRAILKNKVADLRWKRENMGITLTIQDLSVWCDTARGSRDIFLQKFMMMADGDVVNWKFPNTWLMLTKSELGLIVSSGSAHIQSCFDWELAQNQLIDACDSLTELAALVFEDVSQPINPLLSEGI